MKKIFFLFCWVLLVGCSKTKIERNPYLPEVRFSFTINMNLPAYNQLKNPLIPVYIGNTGVGIQGVYVMNSGGSNYVAWEASCPNHQVKSCEKMQLKDGFYVICPCDGNLYSLVNGNIVKQGDNAQKHYSLLNYKVTVSGTTLNVHN